MFAHSRSVAPSPLGRPFPKPPGSRSQNHRGDSHSPSVPHRDGPGQARSPGDGQAHAWVCSDHPSSLPFCCLHKRSVGGGTQTPPEGPSIATPRRTEQRSQGDRGQPPGAPRAEIWGSQPSAQLTLGMAQTGPQEVLGSGHPTLAQGSQHHSWNHGTARGTSMAPKTGPGSTGGQRPSSMGGCSPPRARSPPNTGTPHPHPPPRSSQAGVMLPRGCQAPKTNPVAKPLEEQRAGCLPLLPLQPGC